MASRQKWQLYSTVNLMTFLQLSPVLNTAGNCACTSFVYMQCTSFLCSRKKKDMYILDDMGVSKLSGNFHSGSFSIFNSIVMYEAQLTRKSLSN